MKKDRNSNHTINFFKRNTLNFNSCKNHVLKLVKEYELTHFEIKEISEDIKIKNSYRDILALYVYRKGITSILYCCPAKVELRLLTSRDDFMESINFVGADCWRKGLTHISEF